MAKLAIAADGRPFGEDAAIRAVAEILKQRIQRDFDREVAAARGGPVALRDAHPKHHAFVVARFIVDQFDAQPDLAPSGVFAESGRAYRALVRFSSSLPTKGPDTRSDLRGIAIKLLDVDGNKATPADDTTSQDFLLASSKTFFVRNAIDYVDFTVALARGPLHVPWYFLRKPRRWRDGLALLRPLMPRPRAFKLDSLLSLSYFSQTAYRWDGGAVKYRVTASSATKAVASRFARAATTPNYLSDGLMRHLAAENVILDFSVQVQKVHERMPIEDPMVVWDEVKSPFRKVATIIIPRQNFHTARNWAWAEHASFTPWRSLAVHEPLGGINRTRRVVYDQISSLRRKLNRAGLVEPTLDEWDALAFHSGARFDDLQPV
jgi:hypothetical protein